MTSSSVWSDVKRSLSSDARYDAVGSSSLREELFQSYIRKLASSSTAETPEQASERRLAERKAKQEASLRERQSQVNQERERVEKDVGRSKKGAGREEGERLFGSLLVDQVKDHEVCPRRARYDDPALLGRHRLIIAESPSCPGTMLPGS